MIFHYGNVGKVVSWKFRAGKQCGKTSAIGIVNWIRRMVRSRIRVSNSISCINSLILMFVYSKWMFLMLNYYKFTNMFFFVAGKSCLNSSDVFRNVKVNRLFISAIKLRIEKVCVAYLCIEIIYDMYRFWCIKKSRFENRFIWIVQWKKNFDTMWASKNMKWSIEKNWFEHWNNQEAATSPE